MQYFNVEMETIVAIVFQQTKKLRLTCASCKKIVVLGHSEKCLKNCTLCYLYQFSTFHHQVSLLFLGVVAMSRIKNVLDWEEQIKCDEA